MTDTDTTADRLRELSGTVLGIGHGLHGLARDTDYLVRRAESAEARVEELTTENARLEQEIAEVTEDYKTAADSAGVAHGELRAHEGYIQWLEEQLAEDLAAARTAVPRVIRPDEVRKGQVVALWGAEDATGRLLTAIGTVQEVNDGNLFTPEDMWADFINDWHSGGVTIVLLADAPEDAEEDDGHVYIDVAPKIGPKTKTAIRDIQEHLKRNGHYAEEDRPAGGCDCGCGVTG